MSYKEMKEMNELFGEQLMTKKRKYYFDVKENKDRSRYITLTETRKTPQGPIRNRIFLAAEDIEDFISTLQSVTKVINKDFSKA